MARREPDDFEQRRALLFEAVIGRHGDLFWKHARFHAEVYAITTLLPRLVDFLADAAETEQAETERMMRVLMEGRKP